MQKDVRSLLFTYLIFGIAMAYLESAIVVYLRLLYYPDGFQFPLIQIPLPVALTEIGREAATIVMLWFVARMGGRTFKERFALFIFSFGIWDIFYYIWLKVLINWPHSWLEWDILFLIPLPWVGPWLAPALVSAGFLFAAYCILNYPQKFPDKILSKGEWWLEIAAAVLILASFFWETAKVLQGGIPEYYPWLLFVLAYVTGLTVFFKRYFRKSPTP
ncbi:MAG TPA: hypothetical protein ENK44_11810 [Caldithrix abyssi]|uniref:Carotenoid biosynthesis protein n=1 Tax=Caldithrix abyssi TaxID=187145 RepID=A0A7V4U1M3_CALAY|nr:hypothetical protein [Caldithrix abyssi]